MDDAKKGAGAQLVDSDDSDFYGDEATVSALEARLASFSPQAWWDKTLALRERLEPPPADAASSVAVRQASAPISDRLHNPYAGVPYARQLTESVDMFLSRLPPSKSRRHFRDRPWIFICNPYIARKAKQASAVEAAKIVGTDAVAGKGKGLADVSENRMQGPRPGQGLEQQGSGPQVPLLRGCEDEGPAEIDGAFDLQTFYDGGMARLHILGNWLEGVKKAPRQPTEKEISLERESAINDILRLAQQCGVKAGKWMMFPPASHVDGVWAAVAHATAKNELGIAAKVEPRARREANAWVIGPVPREQDAEDEVDDDVPEDPRKSRLVCVYTSDFEDIADIGRVLEGLRRLGLVQRVGAGASGRAAANRQIYYKPDAYTHLGLAGGNKWGIPGSLYSSSKIFGMMPGRTRK